MYVVNPGLTEVPFTPDGMVRSAGQTISSTSFVQVLSWSADTANYPGSVVVSDALVAQESATGRTVTANLLCAPGSAANVGVTLELRRNGVVLVTGTQQNAPAFSSAVITVTTPANVSINSLDGITLWARVASFSVSASTGWTRII